MRLLTLSLFAFLGLAACSSSGGGTTTTTPGTGSSSSSTGTGGTTPGTSSSSSSTGTGGTEAGTGGSLPLGMPITAPDSTWTWVPFDNAFCADGSSTGIGVNLSSTSTRVLIYLEGGGACWNEATCYTLMSAVNFTTGYSETNFMADSTDQAGLAEPNGFFDRTATANPFQDYSYVYVPYCTGDIFAGNNVVTYGTNTAHYVGFTDFTAYLERIVPTFPTADRVILSGSSAGGFGAAVNWWQTQQAFGKIRVDLIDDSGTPMPPDVVPSTNPTAQAWFSAWNLGATLPPGCTACQTRLDAILGYYDQIYPDHRAALLSYTEDTVLPLFFGISTDQFTMGLQEDLTNYFTPPATFKAFTNDAMGHVLMNTPQLTTSGVTLQTFLTQMVTDDTSWVSVP
jgi:hypothetical protein